MALKKLVGHKMLGMLKLDLNRKRTHFLLKQGLPKQGKKIGVYLLF